MNETQASQLPVYAGNDLGAVWRSSATAFRLWAPTACSAALHRFATGTDAEPEAADLGTLAMQRSEGGTWYLRAYIDKEGGITVDDCEIVSRAFSDRLDAEDFIDDAYIMEVSSPGLGRPLKKEKDYKRSMGKELEIRTYRAIERNREFYGILTAYDDNSVTIEEEDGTERVFQKSDIALIRLAFDF